MDDQLSRPGSGNVPDSAAEPPLLGFVWENRNTVDLDQNLD